MYLRDRLEIYSSDQGEVEALSERALASTATQSGPLDGPAVSSGQAQPPTRSKSYTAAVSARVATLETSASAKTAFRLSDDGTTHLQPDCELPLPGAGSTLRLMSNEIPLLDMSINADDRTAIYHGKYEDDGTAYAGAGAPSEPNRATAVQPPNYTGLGPHVKSAKGE